MGFKDWAKEKKEKAGNWMAEKKKYYSLEERMKRKFAKQDLKEAEKRAQAGKPKELSKLKKAGLGILAAGGAVFTWLKNKNKTKIETEHHKTSDFSVNWMIGLAILYYFVIYVLMPVTDYYIRFSYNIILITLIWFTVLDESEKNGDVLRKLLFIGGIGEVVVPLLLNKYVPDFAFIVYRLPWWLYYAVLQRGKGATWFSKLLYFFLIIYLIGSLFLLLPLLLGIGTSGGLGSGLLFGGDGGGLLGQGSGTPDGLVGLGGIAGSNSGGPLNPLAKVLGTDDTVIGNEQQKDQAKKIYQAAFGWWFQQLVLIKNSVLNVENFAKRKVNEATGAEYYTGKVEENQNLPLGVYLVNLKPTDSEFDYDEQYASVYGTVQTRTLDDPVTIKPDCYAGSKEYISSSDKVIFVQGIVKPSSSFTVYDLDEEDIDCNIPISKSDPSLLTMQTSGGNYKITMTAEFNYETIAYLKTYFMDEQRLHSMRRANLDPFVVFAIKDKQPTAIFTPGPVKLGVGSKKPPIAVSQGNDNELDTGFRLGVTVDNNLGWKGKIKKINELVIYPPVGVSLDLASCTHTFVDYTIESCKKNYLDQITVNSLFKTKPLQDCLDDIPSLDINQCIQKLCLDEFKVEDKTLKAYSLAVDTLSADVSEDIKNYKTFGCRAIVKNRDAVLGDSPISVRYIKAKVKYTYVVEQATNVIVKQKPKTIISATSYTTNTVKVSETKIEGFNVNLPGDLDGFKITNTIAAITLGKITNTEEYLYEYDKTKKALFTFYDFDDDNYFDLITISERNDLDQYEERFMLIQKESKSFAVIFEKFKNSLSSQDVTEMKGSLKIIKNE